jgi:F420-dependent oxidoreductase-like protein
MPKISLMFEGQNGLYWPQWKRLVAEAEDLGFAGIFRSDHFTNANPPDLPSLELVTSLTYLADRSQHLHFGPLVAPVSFRDPIMFIRQAAALDDLSGGRMYLGLGAGWQEREHRLFGYKLGDVKTRFQRLTEALEVATLLLNSKEPVTFKGKHYQLDEATLLPRPQRPGGPRILIGGNGPQKTLPLVARYAHVWNAVFISPELFRERNAQLDELLVKQGRQPGDVSRTAMLGTVFARDTAELERKLAGTNTNPANPEQKMADNIEGIVQSGRLVGTADHMREQIQRFAEAGAEELMVQWIDLEDIEGLRALAKAVL